MTLWLILMDNNAWLYQQIIEQMEASAVCKLYIYSIYIYIGENIELMDLSLLVLMGNHPYWFMENLVMGKSS